MMMCHIYCGGGDIHWNGWKLIYVWKPQSLVASICTSVFNSRFTQRRYILGLSNEKLRMPGLKTLVLVVH